MSWLCWPRSSASPPFRETSFRMPRRCIRKPTRRAVPADRRAVLPVEAAVAVADAEAAGVRNMRDRIGLGWRPELAAGILCNLDRIDVVEVIADDYFDASRRQLHALKTLAA